MTKCAREHQYLRPLSSIFEWPSWQHFIRKYRESKYADYCINGLSHDAKVMRHRPHERATVQEWIR